MSILMCHTDLVLDDDTVCAKAGESYDIICETQLEFIFINELGAKHTVTKYTDEDGDNFSLWFTYAERVAINDLDFGWLDVDNIQERMERADRKLRDKIGDEMYEKIHKLFDEFLEEAIERQFDNLAISRDTPTESPEDELKTLGDKIEEILADFEEGDSVRIRYTESTDNHKETREFISTGEMKSEKECLMSYLSDFKEQGVVEGCDPKGVWFRYFDFELIKKDEGSK